MLDITYTFLTILFYSHKLNSFIVLLTTNEFSLLGRLLADYESREISVELFANELLKLISDEEKVIQP